MWACIGAWIHNFCFSLNVSGPSMSMILPLLTWYRDRDVVESCFVYSAWFDPVYMTQLHFWHSGSAPQRAQFDFSTTTIWFSCPLELLCLPKKTRSNYPWTDKNLLDFAKNSRRTANLLVLNSMVTFFLLEKIQVNLKPSTSQKKINLHLILKRELFLPQNFHSSSYALWFYFWPEYAL